MKPQLSEASWLIPVWTYPLFEKCNQDGYILEALQQALVSTNMCGAPLGNLEPLILSLLFGSSFTQGGQLDS